VVGTTAGPTASPALVGAACVCVAGEPAGWPVWACAAWDPAKVSSVTITTAATHSATAAVATAGPGLARMLSQLIRRAVRASAAVQVDAARRTTRRR